NRKIERQRDDFSHKTSNNLVRDHDLIVFEDLNITGMVKNHHLAKSIADAGWNKIIRYTTYRAESAGKMVILVDPKQTSQECSQCGNIKKDLKLSDRIYHCNVCGLTIDRDLNAAINVLRRGMQSLEENEEKETEHVGRGTPEVTPVEIGSIPERANPVVETGSLRL
ncbi:MAG: RNA-guided endonuclease InsQ/TnpB family protein, partial [Thermoplasmataceae archaeon]